MIIKPENWKPVGGLTLEPNALLAVKEISSSIALTAGPGAGKTELLAQRADFLLRTNNCPYPKRILAISFKTDASKNLKDRVTKRCGSDYASRFDSYTFHAFAKSIIDKFRVVLTGQDELVADYTIDQEKRIDKVQITFNELLPLALKILKNYPPAIFAIQQTYSDIFLDEFQDCTSDQYELIKLIAQATPMRLIAVGDTKQMIMGWAGAVEGIFEDFVSDFNAISLNLYQNFRCATKIRRVINEMVLTMDPNSALNQNDLLEDDGEVFWYKYKSCDDEAEKTAKRIENLHTNHGIPYAEIAILIPRDIQYYGQKIFSQLEANNIPYRNENNLQDMTTEPIVQLIVDFLLCIYCNQQPEAWNRLIGLLSNNGDKVELELNNYLACQRQNVRTEPYVFQSVEKQILNFLYFLGTETQRSLSITYRNGPYMDSLISSTLELLDKNFDSQENMTNITQIFHEEKGVRILTIHKSKGLEFNTVIIQGIEEETFWGEKDSNRSDFFVGISRAKCRLILTRCEERERPINFPNRRRWDNERNMHNEFYDFYKNASQL